MKKFLFVEACKQANFFDCSTKLKLSLKAKFDRKNGLEKVEVKARKFRGKRGKNKRLLTQSWGVILYNPATKKDWMF
jgi:hypothetical protein